MLDKKSILILKSINKFCTTGSYTIISVDEILSKLPKRFKDKEIIVNDLNFLNDKGYIDIKYSDKSEFCICPLAKSRILDEEIIESKKEKNLVIKAVVLSAMFSFVFAFLGAFLGILLLR